MSIAFGGLSGSPHEHAEDALAFEASLGGRLTSARVAIDAGDCAAAIEFLAEAKAFLCRVKDEIRHVARARFESEPIDRLVVRVKDYEHRYDLLFRKITARCR